MKSLHVLGAWVFGLCTLTEALAAGDGTQGTYVCGAKLDTLVKGVPNGSCQTATGNPAQLTLSDKTVVTLKKSCAVDLQALSLRLGIISNVDTPWTQKELAKLLEEAGLQGVFEPELIIASTDAGAEKPGKRIYIYAAERAKVAVSACVFVGENLAEVIGAQVAGMHGQLKPVPVHYADL